MLCLIFLEKINPRTYYFSWSQLINYRREHWNDLNVANWPAPLENVNYISLYALNYPQRKDWCLLNNNHISMQVIWDANIISGTDVSSLPMQIPAGNGFQEAKFCPWRFAGITHWQVGICLALSLDSVSHQLIIFLVFHITFPLHKPNSWVMICCGCRGPGP